jgi:glycosyltransferase involved in cell wall biosynthesis
MAAGVKAIPSTSMNTLSLKSRRRMPRACIVRQTDLYESQIQREADALVADGYDVEFICMRHAERPRRTSVGGVDVTSLPVTRHRGNRLRDAMSYAAFFVMAAWTLTVRHLRRPYAVVQVNTMPDFHVFAAAVPKLLGGRVFLYMHEPTPELAETLFGPGLVSRVLAFVEQRSLAFADHAFTVTEQLKQRYVERGARADAITVVLNGVDAATRFGSWSAPAERNGEGFTVICHGTIEDRYGQDTLVEATRLLRDDLPDLRVVLTGRGSHADAVKAMISTYELEDRIAFEGWVSEERLNDLLHGADVGLVLQKASPYSHLVHTNKLVDYWLFGLPVIASRLDAMTRSYADDVVEYFVPGDAADLARAIRQLHDDGERREALARAGRLAQQENGWSVQRQAYLSPFRSAA